MTEETKNNLQNEASEMMNNGLNEKAIEILNSILEFYRNDESVLFDIADNYREMGEFEQAISYYQNIIADQNNHDIDLAHAMLGICYMSLSEITENSDEILKQAITHYEQAIELNNNLKEKILFDLGLAHMYLGLYEKAIERLEELLTLDSEHYLALSYISVIYDNLGDTLLGIEYMEKALMIDGSNPNNFYSLGLMYGKLSNFSQAIEAYNQAIMLYPEFGEAYTNISDAYLKTGEFDNALKYGLKGFEIDPSDFIALTNIAEAYEKTGDIENAIKYYENALTISPMFEDAIEGLKRLK